MPLTHFVQRVKGRKNIRRGYIIAGRQIIVVFRLVQELKAPRGAKGWAMIYRLRIAKAGPGAGLYSAAYRLRPRVSGLLLTSFLFLARFCVLPYFFSTAWFV